MKLIEIRAPKGNRHINPDSVVWIKRVSDQHCTIQLSGGDEFDVLYSAEEFIKIIGGTLAEAKGKK